MTKPDPTNPPAVEGDIFSASIVTGAIICAAVVFFLAMIGAI